MSSTILAKTSQYIPDASLPYLVKTINSHLVNNEDYTENINKVYNLKGGDVARDIYNFNEKIKRTILSKRSKSEPNLYELNKKNENDFNISDISTPGGFRREFMSSNAKKQGKAPPNWITSNFIDFLALYGHYAGDDDFDEDYYSEGYDSSKYKSKINIEIDNMNENTPLLNVNMSQNTINPRKNRKYRKNNVPSQTGTASEGKTMFLLLKAFIGTGILFLPKAFSNGGMLFSLISLAFSGWLTYFTMILLIRCSEHIGGSYGDIGKQLFGKPFKIMIQGSIALTQSGFCCAYIIFVLQSVKSIISTVGNGSLIIPDWVIITAQVLIYIPLSWIRKIQNFSITSLVADVFILIGLVYIISSDLFIISSNGHSNNYTLFNSDKFPLFLGTAIFAYEGIGLIIPLQRSMKEPEKFPKVLRNSMYIISLAMFIVGGLSYYIFGDDVHTIIFMNVFPDSIVGTVVRALYTLAIVFSFPLTYTGKNSQFIKWMKNVFRAVFVSCLGVIAYYGASNLDNFVSIIGSSCCIPLMFIYPAMLHYYGVAEKPSEKMTDIGVIIFGVISTIWITKLSLEEWK
ncbi:hypothetical protein LY90DRAFT_459332 [Neocallimastix californiae]|uniref:Amino acid transporter transmembrane domain-containing protein n=1 Tax=Neocallimastix californiae TaxID=1754190 RepID=A0A1Y2BSL6_9FUNG|nr:hypothetical protein LY90DRAFT_459332 [Neocallimastix californiae]|eukprot:ORY37740.1 hypothetical protein LY90DRAFT_459332 [Neocallimastix californiae]